MQFFADFILDLRSHDERAIRIEFNKDYNLRL